MEIDMNHELRVNIAEQQLTHLIAGELYQQYSIATAANGVGENYNSEKTPRGWHLIRAKIGQGCCPGTIFVARRPTGDIYSEEFAQRYPEKDWILTRILWLSGLEKGKNRLGSCDTMRRYIYIHGCPDSKPLGVPGSKGCINMRNHDIIKLFDDVPIYTKVFIDG